MIWFVAFQNRIAVYCNGSNHFKTAHSVAKWLNLLLQSYFCSAQVFNGLKSFGWAKSTDQLNFRLLSKLGGDMKNYLCHAFRKIPDVLHVLWEELQKGKDAAAVTGDRVADELSEWSEDGADRTTRGSNHSDVRRRRDVAGLRALHRRGTTVSVCPSNCWFLLLFYCVLLYYYSVSVCQTSQHVCVTRPPFLLTVFPFH